MYCAYMPKGQHFIKHGMAGTPTYQVWKGMRMRCLNPNEAGYKNYGGRGIYICERWNTFANFLADMGQRPDRHSIDRIDNNGPYAPENCRWAISKVQSRNKRNNFLITHNGQTKTLQEWAEITGIHYGTLRSRIIDSKWNTEKAFARPTGRWVNRITFHNETMPLKDWSVRLGINVGTLSSRLNRLHWTVEKAFTHKARIKHRYI